MSTPDKIMRICEALIAGFGDDFTVISQNENSVGFFITYLQYKDTDYGVSLSIPRVPFYVDTDAIAECLPIGRSGAEWYPDLMSDHVCLRTDDDTSKIAQRIRDGEFDEIWA